MQFSEVQKLNHCLVAMQRNSKENMGGIKTQTYTDSKDNEDNSAEFMVFDWVLVSGVCVLHPPHFSL